MNLKYVLDNEIVRHQCLECLGMWFIFDHQGNEAVYRLSPVAPEMCTICKPIDMKVVENSIMSVEQWNKVGEL